MEEHTFVQSYQEHVLPLYRYVSMRCGGDRSLAEDVTQEAWLRAVEVWRRDGPPEYPLAWLKTVARNLLSNYYRRIPHVSLDASSLELDGGAFANGAPWDSPDHAAVVGWGLARLRTAEARLIEAFHLEGHPVAQIAAEMGLSERAVEGRLRRARIKLRQQLEKVVGT